MSCTELMKQAEHCGRLLEAAVEPHGAVEGRLLVHEDVLQFGREGLQGVLAGEVLVRARPARDGVHDATDELLHAAFALGRADLAPEVLGHHDVGGLLRPGARNLHVALLEDHLALLVADHGRADLPFDLVERIDARKREIPRELQAGERLVLVCRPVRLRVGPGVGVFLRAAFNRGAGNLLAAGCSLARGPLFHSLSSDRRGRGYPQPASNPKPTRAVDSPTACSGAGCWELPALQTSVAQGSDGEPCPGLCQASKPLHIALSF